MDNQRLCAEVYAALASNSTLPEISIFGIDGEASSHTMRSLSGHPTLEEVGIYREIRVVARSSFCWMANARMLVFLFSMVTASVSLYASSCA